MRRRLTEVTRRRLEGSVLDLEREKSDLTKLSVLKADPHLHRPSVSWLVWKKPIHFPLDIRVSSDRKSTAQSSEHINLGRNREDEGNEKTRWGKKVTLLAPMSKQSKLVNLSEEWSVCLARGSCRGDEGLSIEGAPLVLIDGDARMWAKLGEKGGTPSESSWNSFGFYIYSIAVLYLFIYDFCDKLHA
ncbi:hypothetical protein DY000_02035894 [Brassica cretica]|uniref:Uncharacterized protein n=1 Tax=Brassica cretica TaxID=69181 RepID=A0ABQ7DS04_BRACR|nr:hypothetical protein DY000_02035894 [Brassica cretica]